MQSLPIYVHVVFVATVVFAIIQFTKAHRGNFSLLAIAIWMLSTGMLALNDFFKITHTMPPRFLVAVLPPFITLLVLLATPGGRGWIDKFDTRRLMLLQTFRIPMELLLYGLFLHQLMPELMTFKGQNMDIWVGITAPVMYWASTKLGKWKTHIGLGWNVLALLSLVFTVRNGILSAPTPWQQFGFEQPNVGVLLFPFIWLPAIAVPLAYYAHVISIRDGILVLVKGGKK